MFNTSFKKIKGKLKSRAFYYLLILIPITQFVIFYVGVNFNSILLAFKKYDIYTGEHSFVFFDNFKNIVKDYVEKPFFKFQFRNSLIIFAVTMFISTPLALLFSYYIYKKGPLHGFFQTVLYIPAIVSTLAFVLIYKYFVELGIPEIHETLTNKKMVGLLTNPDTKFFTILFFNFWCGFGVNVVMYSSAMSSISPSIIEAAEIDGVNSWQEFIKIVFPRIYSTIVVFAVINIAALFTNQMHLFDFYGLYADYQYQTIGYYIYAKIADRSTAISDYPYLAAFGIMLTIISVVITYVLKFLLEKYGPKDE